MLLSGPATGRLRIDRSGPRRHGRRAGGAQRLDGFTLVELIVALTLLATILTGVYGVFQTTSSNVRAVEEQAELTQTARAVLGDLRRELGSVYPMKVPLSEDDQKALGLDATVTSVVSFAGENAETADGAPNDNLRFTAVDATVNRGGHPRFDLVEVMYHLDDDPTTPERGLVREVNHQPGLNVDENQPPERTTITPLATAFSVRFWISPEEADADGIQTEDGWVDEWSDPNKLPAAVEVGLGLTPSRPNAPERRFRMIVRLPIRAPRPDPREQVGGGGGGAGQGGGAEAGPSGGEEEDATAAAEALQGLTETLGAPMGAGGGGNAPR